MSEKYGPFYGRDIQPGIYLEDEAEVGVFVLARLDHPSDDNHVVIVWGWTAGNRFADDRPPFSVSRWLAARTHRGEMLLSSTWKQIVALGGTSGE